MPNPTTAPRRDLEALRQLRRVVAAAPDELFVMRTLWEPTPCGTARCALGWAIIDPWFKNESLLGTMCCGDKHITRSFKVVGEKVFGLDKANTSRLFGIELARWTPSAEISAHAITKDQVLHNIDELLAGRNAQPYSIVRKYE